MNEYVINDAEHADLERRFQHHSPKGNQTERYEIIRATAKEFAKLIMSNCPVSRERSTALTHVDSAVMFANAAIARNE